MITGRITNLTLVNKNLLELVLQAARTFVKSFSPEVDESEAIDLATVSTKLIQSGQTGSFLGQVVALRQQLGLDQSDESTNFLQEIIDSFEGGELPSEERLCALLHAAQEHLEAPNTPPEPDNATTAKPLISSSSLTGLPTYQVAQTTIDTFDEILILSKDIDDRLVRLLELMSDGCTFAQAAQQAGFKMQKTRQGPTSLEAHNLLSSFLVTYNAGDDYAHLLSGIQLKKAEETIKDPVEATGPSSGEAIATVSNVEILRPLLGDDLTGDIEFKVTQFIRDKIQEINARLIEPSSTTDERSIVREESELPTPHIAYSVNRQLEHITHKGINGIVSKYPPGKQKLALQILQRMTQFGNMESLNIILKELEKFKAQGYRIFTEGRGSLPEVIQYLQLKGNCPDSLPRISCIEKLRELHPDYSMSETTSGEKKILLILDDALLENLEKDPEAAKKLYDLKQQHGYQITFLYPEGWINGINPFNHSAANIEQITDNIKEEVDPLIEQGARRESTISYALNKPVQERLKQIERSCDVKGLFKDLQIITNKDYLSYTPESAKEISDQFLPRMISVDQLQEAFSKLNLDPEYVRCAAELLERDLVVFSPLRISRIAENIQAQIEELARKKSIPPEKIYFYIPVDRKSYSIAMLQHRIANNIPSERIITFNEKDKLPKDENSLVVVIDDCAATGESAFKEFLGIRGLGYKGEIAFAPTLATTPAKILFDELSLKLSGLSFLPGMVHDPFIITNYYKNLSNEDKIRFNVIMRGQGDEELGHGNYGTSLVYPYMSPNNNNQFIQLFIALLLTLGSNGVKAFGREQKKAVSARKREMVST